MEENFNLLFKKTQIMVREISILLDFLTSILWLTDVFMKTCFFFFFFNFFLGLLFLVHKGLFLEMELF